MSKDNQVMQFTQQANTVSKLRLWRKLTLRSQLMFLVNFIILIVVFFITFASVLRENTILREDLVEQSTALLDALEAATQDFLYFLDVDTIKNISTSFASNPTIELITIYDSNGRVLTSTGEGAVERRLEADPFGTQLLDNEGVQLLWIGDRITAGRYFSAGRQTLGAAHVELSTDDLTEAIRSSVNRGVMSAIAASIVGLIGVLVVSRTITAPITDLVNTTRVIADGDLTSPITVHGSCAEITELSTSVEVMRTNLHVLYVDMENRIMSRTEELRIARDDALAAQRLANENSRLKSEFLATMSHELRTPLNAIEGFTGIILERMAGVELNDKTERFVQKIQSNSRRLLGLINDFLDLSRIEAGRLELANSPISTRAMTQIWYDSLSSLAENRGLSLNVIVDPTLPSTIYGDEEALTKIAFNLVGNAIKFTHIGEVTLKMTHLNDQIELVVSDTGIGIPPHAKEFIFDEFRQVDQSSRRSYGGSGLGLAITQKLVRMMGGTITLQSEVGVGSTFKVLLPSNAEATVLA